MRIFSLQFREDGSVETSLRRSLKAHGTHVVAIAVDHTGTLLATGGTDGVVKVWDIHGGFATHTFHGPSGLVTSLHFYEAPVRPGDETTNRKKTRVEPDDPDAVSVRFRLLSGHQEGKIRMWDLHRRAGVATLESHVSDVTGLDYSPEEETIVSCSRDKTLVWWDARSCKIRRISPCLELVEDVGFAAGGKVTFAGGANGLLRFWETGTGREMTTKADKTREGEGIVQLVYRPGMPFVLCVQGDNTLALYRVPTKNHSGPASLVRRICGTHDEIIDLRYVLPDRSIMALATNAEDIRLVSTTAGDTKRDDAWAADAPPYFGQDVGTLKGHEDIIISMDVDWSGHWIATGAKDNMAKLWKIDSAGDHVCWATFSGHAESVGAVALPRSAPPAGTPAHADPSSHPPAFIITGSQDQTIKKWEISRQPQKQKSGTRAVFTRKAHDKDINALDVHHSSGLFASASQDKTVKIWDAAEGEVQGILRGHKRGVWSVAFSPHDLPAMKGDDGPESSSRGVLLTASGDKTIKLWSMTSYACLRTFEGHSNTVLKVVWMKMPVEDKKKRFVHFASAGADGLVKIWDANSGETECTLDNHEDRVWSLALDRETNTLASGSSDSTVTFWSDTSVETQAALSLEKTKLVEQEQELENYMRVDDYRRAITLALQLNHPGRLLSLFTSVVTTPHPDPNSLSGVAAVDDVLAALSDEQLFALLLRLRDWNTSARTAHVAQRVLGVLVRSYPAERFAGLGRGRAGDLVQALRGYTERHYKRVEELVDESYLVEYTLREMDALGSLDADGDGDGDVVMQGVVV